MQLHFDDGNSVHSGIVHRLEISNRRPRRQCGELVGGANLSALAASVAERFTAITLLFMAFDLRQSVSCFHIPARIADYQVR